MNKREFLDRVKHEDKILLSNIYDKIILHEKINSPLYLNEFYPPSIWKPLINMRRELGCKISGYGIFDESDRKMISILNEYDEENIYSYPVELIRIDNKSLFTNLKHSDFLGALMSQGIKREKFGDLILENQSCYVPVSVDISLFIKDNLFKIGKSPCKIETVELYNAKIPTYKFERRHLVVTSMRIDSMVSALCGVSRSVSQDTIKKGHVLVNYEKILRKDAYVEIGSIITVRGYGKFKIEEYIGKTLKKREKIVIKKYI